jgi:hypothetical protein
MVYLAGRPATATLQHVSEVLVPGSVFMPHSSITSSANSWNLTFLLSSSKLAGVKSLTPLDAFSLVDVGLHLNVLIIVLPPPTNPAAIPMKLHFFAIVIICHLHFRVPILGFD